MKLQLVLRGELLERDMEEGDFQFMVESSLGVFIEGLGIRIDGIDELYAPVGNAVVRACCVAHR